MKAEGQYRIRLDVSEHRRILVASMIDAAERHAGVLTSHWALSDGPLEPDASMVCDATSTDRLRLRVHADGRIQRELLLHWPVRSSELFASLNQAALLLNNRGGSPSAIPSTGMTASDAHVLLRDWRRLRRSNQYRLTLCAGERPLLAVDAITDRVTSLSPNIRRARNLLEEGNVSLRWRTESELPAGKPLCRSTEVLWLLAEVSAGQGLLPELEHVAISLRGWPAEVVHGLPAWTTVLKLLRRSPATATDLLEHSGCSPAELHWFLNGCLCSGYLRLGPVLTSEMQPRQIARPAHTQVGHFRRALTAIRHALGIPA